MRVGLIPIDGKRPNLALMRLSAYHKHLGDKVTLSGRGDINYISCIFTHSRPKVEGLIESWGDVVAGGPGWDTEVNLPPEVEAMKPDYSLYGLDYGMGHLTRGCPNDCPFCVVWKIEGRKVHTVATAGDLLNDDSKRLVIMDANLLSSEDAADHLDELYERGLTVCFDQGIDLRAVTELLARKLVRIKITDFHFVNRKIHCAWDTIYQEAEIKRGINFLVDAGVKPRNIRPYMLVGYNTTEEENLYRLRRLVEWGCDPVAMVYRETATSADKDFARWVNAWIYKVVPWEQYRRRAPDGQMVIGGDACATS